LAQFDAAQEPGGATGDQVVSMNGAWRFALNDDVGERIVAAALHGHSLWWTTGSPDVEPTMLTCAGMPRAQGFAAMLNGTWH
jgi:type VI secretion system protein ImpM